MVGESPLGWDRGQSVSSHAPTPRLGRANITPHGFRSTFRDWAAEQTNAPRAVCEAALAHALRDKTEAAYHRTDLFERRRELMESWATFATTKTCRHDAVKEVTR